MNQAVNYYLGECFCPSSLLLRAEARENTTSFSNVQSNACTIEADTSLVLYYNGGLRKASFLNNSFSGKPTLVSLSRSEGSFLNQFDFAINEDDGIRYGFTPNNFGTVGLSRTFIGSEIGESVTVDFVDRISPHFEYMN